MPHPVRLYLGLIRFSHTVFALPFALASAAVAWRAAGRVELVEVIGILACMVAARTAAMERGVPSVPTATEEYECMLVNVLYL